MLGVANLPFICVSSISDRDVLLDERNTDQDVRTTN